MKIFKGSEQVEIIAGEEPCRDGFIIEFEDGEDTITLDGPTQVKMLKWLVAHMD
jgi:hypothetical protein